MRCLLALGCTLLLFAHGCGESDQAIELCTGSDDIRYVGRFTLSDGPPFPGNGFVSVYGQNFAAIDGRCRFWVLDSFESPGALLLGSLDEDTAAAIERQLFGFDQLVGTHSDPDSSFDAVITLYTPAGIAIRPNAAEIGSEEAAVRIQRLHGEVHQTLRELGVRADGPIEYMLAPELDEDVLGDCFGDQSVPWPLEESIGPFLTEEPGTVRELTGDTASAFRELGDRYREGFEGPGIFSTCGAMVAVTGPDDTAYRLVLRDVVPPEVIVAEGMLRD